MATSIIGFDSAWTDQVKAPGAVSIIRIVEGRTDEFGPRSHTLMIGDLNSGYILTPAVGEARKRLRSAGALRGIACS